jgi:ATP-dependent Clp protease ATP-binding subunit ClpA
VIGFEKFLAGVLDRAGHEARDSGSSTVEAQHLLLAIAAVEEPTTHQMLASAGLTYPSLRAALDREFEQSLAAAGVSLAALGGPAARSAPVSSPDIGASVKLALDRGFRGVARKRDLRPAHLLLGILLAEVGTVPRALALAGVDRPALIARVRRGLTAEGERGKGEHGHG